jgi:hypothetical protein
MPQDRLHRDSEVRKSVTDVGLRVRMTCRTTGKQHPAT